MELIINPKDIERIRKQVGLTQRQLANLSGVSQSLIAKVEKGEIDPVFSKIKTISNILLSFLLKSSKKVSDIMNRNVIYVSPYDKIKVASEKMIKYNISQLPVIEDGKMIGSISEKTIVEKLSEEKYKKQIFDEKVKDIMNSPFPTVNEDTPIDAIYSLLIYYPAIIVTTNSKITGIITKADILKFSSKI